MNIRDRIKELRRVPASDLAPNPKNWRTHPEAQENALRGVLAEVGWADACIARELPDGTLMLIDGHLRAETAGADEVPVLVLDVTESEADLILATIDPLAAMADTDDVALRELLDGMSSEDADVQAMLDGMMGDDGGGQVVEYKPKEPIKRQWVLIGCPVESYGDIAELVTQISMHEGILMEKTVGG